MLYNFLDILKPVFSKEVDHSYLLKKDGLLIYTNHLKIVYLSENGFLYMDQRHICKIEVVI